MDVYGLKINYTKKAIIFIIVLVLVLLALPVSVYLVRTVFAAESCVSAGAGDWDTSGTWGSCGGVVPQAGDSVSIGHAVDIGDYTINEVANITIASGGTLTQSNVLPQTISGTLTVESGGTLTHTAHASGDASNIVYSVNIIANIVTVDSGGTISATSKGHAGGYNSGGAGYGPGPGLGGGVAGPWRGSGGAHCGDGADSDLSGGAAYCDISDPATMGSGGGGDYGPVYGGWGGGLIILNATGTITIDGTITADGGNGQGNWNQYAAAGGGAGGTISLSAGTVTSNVESTVMSVSGGDGGLDTRGGGRGGGGGGGLIYIYTDNFSITSDMLDITGGPYGVTSAGVGLVNWIKVNPDAAGSTCTSWVDGDWDRMAWNCGRLPLATDSVVIDHAVAIPSGFTLPGDPYLEDLTIADGGTLTQSNKLVQTIAGDLLVQSGGTLTHTTHASGDASNIVNSVNIQANNITIAGTVSANAKGHAGGYSGGGVGYGPGPGIGGLVASSPFHASGGAHCGDGGTPSGGDGGDAYCDTADPTTMGSGGGGDSNLIYGGWGGGLISLSATGTFAIGGGTITATGGNGDNSWQGGTGGGAGGTIYISADTVSGTPASLSVAGGSSGQYTQNGNYYGGAGGGGLIYVLYSSAVSITSDDAIRTGGANGVAGVAGEFLPVLSNTAPTVTVNSAAQKTDGTGTVDISVEADDADDNDMMLKLEYKAGADCSSGTSDPTMDEGAGATADTSDSGGTPSVVNSDTYQIGTTATRRIDTGSAVNTVTFDWSSATDVAAGDGTYCIKITPNDDTADGTAATTTFTVDNVAPTSAGNLTLNAITTTSITHDFGVAGSDTNIDNYKVYYKAGASGVATSDSLDATIATGAYDADATNELSGLSVNTQYVANIWTYDSYGNSNSASEIAKYTAAATPTSPTVLAASTTTIDVTLGAGDGNPGTTTYAIQETGTGNYVQGDGTLSGSAIWDTLSNWGTKTVTGLSANTQYSFKIKARNGDSTETTFSSTVSKYTWASPVTSVGLADATTSSAYGLTLTWTDASQTGLKIDLSSVTDGACDSTYDVGNFDNTADNSSSPRAISVAGNTCYKAKIQSYNGDGILNTTDIVYSSGVTSPATQPTSLTNTDADTNYITWGWDAVTEATNYKIYRSSDDALIGETGNTDVSFTQTTVTSGGAAVSPNTQYTVYVRADNANGEGIASSTASTYTTANLPTTLSHELASQTTAAMKWTWVSGGAQSDFYSYTLSPSGNSGYTANAYWSQASLSANTQYTYYVKARDGGGALTSAVSSNGYTAQTTPTDITFSSMAVDSIVVGASGSFANLETASSGVRFQNTTTSADNTLQVASWTNSSLTANTQYTYVVSGVNGDGDETSTITENKYTLSNTPTSVSTSTVATTAITITAAGTLNNLTSGTSGLYFDNVTEGTNSGWTQTNSWADSGLTANTQYNYKVKSRNGESVETSYTSEVPVYTAQNTPTSVSQNSIDFTSVTVDANGTFLNLTSDTSGLYYENVTAGTNSGWVQSTSWESTGLSPNTAYEIRVKARNGDSVETAFTSATSITTAVPPRGGVGVVSSLVDNGDDGGDAGNVDDVVDTGEVENEVVDAGEVADDIVDAGEVANDVVDAGEVANDVVDAGEVADDIVDAGEVASDVVDEEDTAQVVEVESIHTHIPVLPVNRDLKKEVSAIKEYVTITKTIPTVTSDWYVVHFLSYGGSEHFENLTQKQRQSILEDFEYIYGYMPATEKDWENLDKISSGEVPSRVLAREVIAVKTFAQVFGRIVDFSNVGDERFVHMVAYRLRVLDRDRDLEKEKQALSKFISVFQDVPKSSGAWGIVRAIAYTIVK